MQISHLTSSVSSHPQILSTWNQTTQCTGRFHMSLSLMPVACWITTRIFQVLLSRLRRRRRENCPERNTLIGVDPILGPGLPGENQYHDVYVHDSTCFTPTVRLPPRTSHHPSFHMSPIVFQYCVMSPILNILLTLGVRTFARLRSSMLSRMKPSITSIGNTC